jgi:hypothetical protein
MVVHPNPTPMHGSAFIRSNYATTIFALVSEFLPELDSRRGNKIKGDENGVHVP